MNDDDTMNFSTVCRTCLSTDALFPIFVSDADHTGQASAVFITTGIKVELNDGLPQKMCTICVSYINTSLKFRKQCKDAENMLLQLKPTNNPHEEDFFNTNEIENSETLVEDLKFDYDILKTELKCKFEASDGIKIDGVGIENDAPLHSWTEKIQNEGKICDVPDKRQSVKRMENGKSNKKSKIQRVSCTICGKDLSARSLRAHVATRHAPAAASPRCGYCKLEHSSKEALVAHTARCPLKEKRRASESGKELVPCDVCHKMMQRGSLRAHHAVQHRGLGPVCEHCGRRFGNKLRLSEHLRAKHGHDKLRCGQCHFTSSSSAALQNHERRHRGEKPFVCETCGAKFHAAYLLTQHRHSHRTEKKVKCGLCGAAFKSSNSLHAHRMARHGARRYRCLMCPCVYSCRHYAVKHLRTVHGFKGTVPPLQVDSAPTGNNRADILTVQ